jgi:hypothetical protein
MQAIDWNAPANLLERDDAGSDLHYEFKTIASGRLAELVRHVAALGSGDRARMVIDSGNASYNVGQIMELAAREDLP